MHKKGGINKRNKQIELLLKWTRTVGAQGSIHSELWGIVIMGCFFFSLSFISVVKLVAVVNWFHGSTCHVILDWEL